METLTKITARINELAKIKNDLENKLSKVNLELATRVQALNSLLKMPSPGPIPKQKKATKKTTKTRQGKGSNDLVKGSNDLIAELSKMNNLLDAEIQSVNDSMKDLKNIMKE